MYSKNGNSFLLLFIPSAALGQVGVCQPPRFNFEAGRIDECVRCFCFGHTETCYSSNLQISQVSVSLLLALMIGLVLSPAAAPF